MVSLEEIRSRAKDWGVPYVTAERDYVFSHLIKKVCLDDELRRRLIPCDGLSLRKFFFEDYRFSDEIHFATVGESLDLERIKTRITLLTEAFGREGAIDFSCQPVEISDDSMAGDSGGPLQEELRKTFKIDFFYFLRHSEAPGLSEEVGQHAPRKMSCRLFPMTHQEGDCLEERALIHPFGDAADFSFKTKVYRLEEALARKIVFLLRRRRAQDLWDAGFILRHSLLDLDLSKFKTWLFAKLSPLAMDINPDRPLFSLEKQLELRRDWDNSLSRKIGPGIEGARFDDVFREFQELLGAVLFKNERELGLFLDAQKSPLERGETDFFIRHSAFFSQEARGWEEALGYIRFAQENRLRIRMKYKDRWRLLEPYLVHLTERMEVGLNAWSCEDRRIKTFLISPSRLQGLLVEKESFRPRFPLVYQAGIGSSRA